MAASLTGFNSRAFFTFMTKGLLGIAAILAATSATAGDIIVGIGQDDVFDQTETSAVAAVLEYHADPFFDGQIASHGFAGAIYADADSDVFLGFGIASIWRLGDGPWFVETSIMPGYYDAGSGGTDLGGNWQFRSLIGLGYRFDGGSRISLALDHKSNADLEEDNPGSETVMLRYRLDF